MSGLTVYGKSWRIQCSRGDWTIKGPTNAEVPLVRASWRIILQIFLLIFCLLEWFCWLTDHSLCLCEARHVVPAAWFWQCLRSGRYPRYVKEMVSAFYLWIWTWHVLCGWLSHHDALLLESDISYPIEHWLDVHHRSIGYDIPRNVPLQCDRTPNWSGRCPPANCSYSAETRHIDGIWFNFHC